MADREHAFPARRAAAARNRERILAAAHEAFEAPGVDVSMAEIARRADVGMATLYRNFSGRQELLEAVYLHEVDEVCSAAENVSADMPAADSLFGWLGHVFAFTFGKRLLANELFPHFDANTSIAHGNRRRALAAGQPLMDAARDAGQIRADLSLDQIFDLIVAVAQISDDLDYVEPLFSSVLDGLAQKNESG